MQQMTDRQRDIKARLDLGKGAREIAEELGITRNAVYQSIQRMRRDGILPNGFTPTGLPAREPPGSAVLAALLSEDQSPDDALAGKAALAEEIKRTRDQLDTIARRLSNIVGR